MPGEESPDGNGVSDQGGTTNVSRGRIWRLVQARNIYGGIHFARSRWLEVAVLVGAVIIAVAILVVHGGDAGSIPSPSPPSLAAGQDPLLVAVSKLGDTCRSDLLTTKRPDELGPPPQELSRWTDWGALSDGVPVRNTDVLLTVQAVDMNSVTITGLDIHIKREPRLTGTVLTATCGGPTPFRWTDVDLDSPRPRAVPRELTQADIDIAAENGWNIEPVRFPYTVSAQDSETFAIHAFTNDCYCTWTVDILWSSAGRTGSRHVDDAGKPFRTTADGGTIRCMVTRAPETSYTCVPK